jgi:prolyl-tRNA editing enzyme YbaK/EbsC (Cys-tRNA(Pro) deacylase)
MSLELSLNAQRVQQALAEQGMTRRVVELPASTRTSPEAAAAVGCQVGQIAKSLIFVTQDTRRPILIIASGANRVNEKNMAALVGEPLGKADADFVRLHTGFSIGGVPPLCHSKPLETYVDEDLLQYKEIWAAAGTPHAVFRLSPAELVKISGGRIVCVR